MSRAEAQGRGAWDKERGGASPTLRVLFSAPLRLCASSLAVAAGGRAGTSVVGCQFPVDSSLSGMGNLRKSGDCRAGLAMTCVGGSFKFGVSSVKMDRSVIWLQTSHFTLVAYLGPSGSRLTTPLRTRGWEWRFWAENSDRQDQTAKPVSGGHLAV